MPERIFWFGSKRDSGESKREADSDKNVAEFLGTATSSKKTTGVPQRWTTIPGSQAHGAGFRVSSNLPPPKHSLPVAVDQTPDTALNQKVYSPSGRPSTVGLLPQQQKIRRVPVPAPTTQYIGEVPGSDIIAKDHGARRQTSPLNESGFYSQPTCETCDDQDNSPEAGQPPSGPDEFSFGGRTYRVRFPTHESIAKPHAEFEGEHLSGIEADNSALSASVRTLGPSQSFPAELPADSTQSGKPLPPCDSETCSQRSNRTGKSVYFVCSEVPTSMDTATVAVHDSPDPPRDTQSRNSSSPVLSLPFHSQINEPFFDPAYISYFDGNAQRIDGHATRPVGQETGQQTLRLNNAQLNSTSPGGPVHFAQPGSFPPTHYGGVRNMAFDTSSQNPPVTASMADGQNTNPSLNAGPLEISPSSPVRETVLPVQTPDTRRTFNHGDSPIATQISQGADLRYHTTSQEVQVARHEFGQGVNTRSPAHEPLDNQITGPSEVQHHLHRGPIRLPEQREPKPPAAETVPREIPTRNMHEPGQSSADMAAQSMRSQERTNTSMPDPQGHSSRISDQSPAYPPRETTALLRESSLNADLNPGITHETGRSMSRKIPSSKQSQNLLTKPAPTPNPPSRDATGGMKNWKVVKKVANLVGSSGTPVTYSPEEMTRRCLVFMGQNDIRRDDVLDPFSTILVYARDRWKYDKAQIQEQSSTIENLESQIQTLRSRKEKLKSTLEATQKELDRMTIHRDELKNSLTSTVAELNSSRELLTGFQESFDRQVEYNQQLTGRLRAVEDENERVFKMGQRKIKDLHEQSSRSIQELQDRNSKTIQQLRAQNSRTVSELQDRTARLIMEKDQELDNVKGSLGAQIIDLKKRIASYAESGFRFVVDDKFRDKMQVTEQMISRLASYITRPSFQNLDSDLDPTGFLRRNQEHLGNRIWIKFIFGMCWGVLKRGFFGSPLGFGIFGQEGEGFALLDHIHQILAVYDPTTNKHGITNEKETNEVRGFLFERIWDVISTASEASPEYQTSTNDAKGLSLYFCRHVDAVTKELVSVLYRCSGNNLDSRAPATIRELVRHVGLLGLEMATQRAHLALEFCAHGDAIQQGTLFVDETLGEGASGTAWVDFLTEPALTRLGNGRNDLTGHKILRAGTFVALRNPS